MPNPTLLASTLFAQSQGSICSGAWQCHWCGGACTNEFVHDDPPPVPFIRSRSTAKRPSEAYICQGCWLWRRRRVTVKFLGGGLLDGQEAKNHSWWITEEGAWTLQGINDFIRLYHTLIKPPKKFILSLRIPDNKIDNLLQLAVANNPGGILAETTLHYTLNNIHHTFTIYELIEAIRNGPGPYGPGVNSLWGFLGEPPDDLKRKYPPVKEEESKRGKGRPLPKEDAKYTTKKVVVASGT